MVDDRDATPPGSVLDEAELLGLPPGLPRGGV
jgi:hypothetical protein